MLGINDTLLESRSLSEEVSIGDIPIVVALSEGIDLSAVVVSHLVEHDLTIMVSHSASDVHIDTVVSLVLADLGGIDVVDVEVGASSEMKVADGVCQIHEIESWACGAKALVSSVRHSLEVSHIAVGEITIAIGLVVLVVVVGLLMFFNIIIVVVDVLFVMEVANLRA